MNIHEYEYTAVDTSIMTKQTKVTEIWCTWRSSVGATWELGVWISPTTQKGISTKYFNLFI